MYNRPKKGGLKVLELLSIPSKARQTGFIVLHQRLLHLRPAILTVIIAFQTMTRP